MPCNSNEGMWGYIWGGITTDMWQWSVALPNFQKMPKSRPKIFVKLQKLTVQCKCETNIYHCVSTSSDDIYYVG